MVIGVLAALLLNQQFRGRTLLRALMILPWALPTVVNATLWRLIYNPEYRRAQRGADADRPASTPTAPGWANPARRLRR